jgi:TetR/AcrR family transcriptional repressor of lmrAB and yxaGH operons
VAGDTRARMLVAATEALRRSGVAGMSFTEVLGASGAARGAIYHHFPGGKAQLVAEAAGQHGAEVLGHLATLSGGSPAEVVRAFLAAVRPVVAASAAGSGCAVAAVALSPTGPAGPLAAAGTGTGTTEVAAAAFDSWVGQLTATLTTAGAPPTEAAELASALIALLEGAHVLCRAAGDLAPFDRAASAIDALVRSRYPG